MTLIDRTPEQSDFATIPPPGVVELGEQDRAQTEFPPITEVPDSLVLFIYNPREHDAPTITRVAVEHTVQIDRQEFIVTGEQWELTPNGHRMGNPVESASLAISGLTARIDDYWVASFITADGNFGVAVDSDQTSVYRNPETRRREPVSTQQFLTRIVRSHPEFLRKETEKP